MALGSENQKAETEREKYFPLTEISFRRIFDAYYPRMVSKANAILKDEALAKDAAQYVFMNLWKSRASLHIQRSLEAYLMTGTQNRSLSLLKSRRLHGGSATEEHLHHPTKLNPQAVIEGLEMRERIHRAIDALPERCRRVFVLCRLEGFSHREVSEQLGISTKTIENQMTRALKELRAVLLLVKTLCLCWLI